MAKVSEEICVTAPAPEGAFRAAAGAAPPRSIGLARAALLRGDPVPAPPLADVLAFVPPRAAHDAFEVRAAAVADPADPGHGWVVVEGATSLGSSGVPLRLTVMLSLAGSMADAPTNALPLLQDSGPGKIHQVNRITLAKAVLDDLARRLPERAEVALVVFDGRAGRVLLPPTPATAREQIRDAIDRITASGSQATRSALDTAYALAGDTFDPCADHRMLLVTDDQGTLDPDVDRAERVVRQWAGRGLELWSVSLALFGREAPSVASLTAAGGGIHFYADTRSEAVEPLAAALRTTGAVAREPRIDVAWAEGVSAVELSGLAPFALPTTVEGGWRDLRVYEVRRDAAATGPFGSVTWRAGSPVPGEWELAGTIPLDAAPLGPESPPIARERVFAAQVGRALAAEGADWGALAATGRALQLPTGPARELAVWADLMASRAAP